MEVKIKEEVLKQINVGFLVTSVYPQWIANIVLVPKKDGKVCMCVDYRDLNKASPKDVDSYTFLHRRETRICRLIVFSHFCFVT